MGEAQRNPSSTHYRWTVRRDSMVHERHPERDCDRFDRGGAGRVGPAGRLRTLDRALIAAALGDVHEQYVWRFLRAQQIDLAGRKSRLLPGWCGPSDD
jgi:hypothetical protein